ncbi:hypothetical protein CDL12_27357 [Handroanthus impetiginosus]|uniref:Uncharacterized protein n=1 Tax=Handroanthus impetiginosus TaxID=429701 RepID=A0A2G9G4A4_9LAMI|nr:hypothetical protein CDL12_29256 [Handroanthus impetiginosus]PIN00144.1 hypothetical protein CDL12_27357 [Handroanthus impetiginosus]
MESSSQPLGFCQRLMNFIMCKISRPTTHDSEVTVEFRHIDKSQKSTQTDEQTLVQDSLENKANQQDSSDRKTDARGKRPKKSVTFEESVGEGETHEKNQATKGNPESHEDAKLKPPRHWGPLQTVASHINEKAAAFIDRKKNEMKRNYSVDQQKS